MSAKTKAIGVVLIVTLAALARAHEREAQRAEAQAFGHGAWAEAHRIPECQEDAVLIGAGAFDRGTWEHYVCGPSVDDYEAQP
jgi:hypothetical protein